MIQGLVTVEITGADLPATLEKLTASGITLICTVPNGELSAQVTVVRQEYAKLKRICEKRGDSIRFCGRKGAYWWLKSLLNRPVLLVGLFLLLCCALYLPTRVLFVQVEGNSAVPTRKILAMAEQCGIGFGASRRAVRSERMKNALLEAVPELQWAGVNTRGCMAVISVRERTEQEAEENRGGFGHVVAVTDGVVTHCTATRGSLLCAPGQGVSAGEILISGYTDTGLTIRAEQAAGEVYGQTMRRITAVTPVLGQSASKNGEELKKISLLLGKKRINLWKDSGIWDATCDRMYEEYYITLPGGFQLPVALAVERYVGKDCVSTEIPWDAAKVFLTKFAENYLLRSIIAGTVHASELSFDSQPGVLILAGEYRSTELIGVMQRVQIGEQNGKNN